MTMRFKFADLFASVGSQCVFASEIDENACETYAANFNEQPQGDIRKIPTETIPDFDILLGGFPCQAFSIIGKKNGFDDETSGTLFFEIERILKAKRPSAFMLENVRNLTAHDGGKTFRIMVEHLQRLGYHVYSKVLNALDYGLPQKRERIIIVGFSENVFFKFPAPLARRKTLREILQSDVSRHYYVSENIRDSRLARLKVKNFPKPYISHENISKSVTPHEYCSALRAGASANYLLVNDERRLTEREMLRLQGFPEDFKIVLPYSKIRQQCGNSVAVPMIEAVAREMITALSKGGACNDL